MSRKIVLAAGGTPMAASGPVLVPGLDDLARDPSQAAALPPDAARALFGQAVLVQTALLPYLGTPEPRPERVEVLGVEEAARRLGTSADSLYRKRKRLRLGYIDPLDGKLKFTTEEVDRYICRQGRG